MMRRGDLFVCMTGKLRMRGFENKSKIVSVGDEKGSGFTVILLRLLWSFEGSSYKKSKSDTLRRT